MDEALVAEDEATLPITVLVAPFLKEIECPICMIIFTACHMTPCGHNFCEGCIKEALNRKHQCPCCNAECVEPQLIRNRHMDKIVEMLSNAKKESTKKYYEDLFKHAANQPRENSQLPAQAARPPTLASGPGATPIQRIFQTHLVKSLAAYETYYEDLVRKCDAAKAKLREGLVEAAASLHTPGDGSIAALQADSDRRCEQLDREFQHSVELLLQSFESHMSEFAPPPMLLPSTVHVSLPAHHMQFDLTLRNTDSLSDVREVIERRFRDLGDPVVSFPPDGLFVLQRAFADMNDAPVDDSLRPIIQYGAPQGSTLVFTQRIRLASDVPRNCMTLEFVKNNTYDYYECQDCNYKWICAPCAQQCHRGHRTSFVIKHTPSYACCYCSKRGQCKIPNKLSVQPPP